MSISHSVMYRIMVIVMVLLVEVNDVFVESAVLKAVVIHGCLLGYSAV
jgi:hypothetical protein